MWLWRKLQRINRTFMSNLLSQNHFELFGFSSSYDIDLLKLSEIYRELQKTVHPDRFANASDSEKLLSAQKATRVNEAYSCLKSPIQRAQYLLEINNIKYNNEAETIQDPEFLMEQMELREALANINGSNDALASLDIMLGDIGKRINRSQNQLSDLFIELTENNLLRAKKIIQEMQFLIKLQHEAEDLEEDLINAQ
ncbi:Chaperone protein HscB [hydrothermal vent metagenome]|uniref:Chaperone protein HscB n=1 Tax=hydrothermal vent metagenome TaxID=652676 RepID=A0A3B0ZZG9_9ZZZZ